MTRLTLYEYAATVRPRFELLRPVARMDEPALCPKGHDGGERVLSTFAAFSQGSGGAGEALGGGGGCSGCSGGNCACCSLN